MAVSHQPSAVSKDYPCSYLLLVVALTLLVTDNSHCEANWKLATIPLQGF